MSKVALVTGSTSGIGKSIALKFAKEGINVGITGFGTDEEIQSILAELRGFGIKAEYFAANLLDSNECRTLIERCAAHFDRLDILVNNAGMQFVAPITEFPDDKWEMVMALNLSANFYTIKATLPIMRKNGWGRIINIASTHAIVASANKSAYVAAKHGLIGLTKVTALETALENITCNAICPGFVYTPLVEAQIVKRSVAENTTFDEAKLNLISEKHPSKNYISMEDLSELVFFLTRDCAKEIRGSAYTMDGGWVAV